MKCPKCSCERFIDKHTLLHYYTIPMHEEITAPQAIYTKPYVCWECNCQFIILNEEG
jgi:hypothetical protein